MSDSEESKPQPELQEEQPVDEGESSEQTEQTTHEPPTDSTRTQEEVTQEDDTIQQEEPQPVEEGADQSGTEQQTPKDNVEQAESTLPPEESHPIDDTPIQTEVEESKVDDTPQETEPAIDEPPKPEEIFMTPLAVQEQVGEFEKAVPENVLAVVPVDETVAAEKEEVKEKPKPEKAIRKKVRSTRPDEGVDLAMLEGEVGSSEPITVGNLFKEAINKYPDVAALKWKEKDGEQEFWKQVTYTQYYRLCINAAKSFLKLGLEKYHGVGIIGFNSKEWLISNLGAIFAGGLACGVYATNGPEACQYVLHNCKANVVIVENQVQLDKILQVRDQLPDLKAIVQYKGKLSQEYENVYDWETFMELGKETEDKVIEDKMAAQRPEQCALLIYTSGTTGDPKGVMLSHDNLTFTARAFHQTLAKDYDILNGNERIISYLPLSHIAAQLEDIYLPLLGAATIYFAQPDALKGSLLQTLQEVRPTVFFGVPRVWEKFAERMQAAGAQVTGIKKMLGQWAMGVGFEANRSIQNKQSLPWTYKIANGLVLKKIHERLGMDQVKAAFTGAAPIHKSTLEYFMRVNIPVLELYGMSEDTGPHTVNSKSRWRVGSVGFPLHGVKMKLHDKDEHGEGEICMYGRHVFMGYLNNEEKTKESIDDEGWLHSGDIGKLDKDGYLYVTGRIKELIITAGGENIAPVPIEDRIKKELPFLSNVMVIGDKRKFLSCLVTLKCEVDLETAEPQDELTGEAKTLIGKLDCSYTKVSEIRESKDEKIYNEIQAGLERANKNAISNAQRVQKFILLSKDFSVPGGELGPTLKLKRYYVMKKYTAEIDSMYEEVSKV